MEAQLTTAVKPIEVPRRIVAQVSRSLEGKVEVIELAVTSLLAGGHLLVEDVPGVGKTTLARALARSLGVSFRRLQFTSDLMPADILGGSVFDQHTGEFCFRPGPVFTHVLLADEINRTTPRTQSALLEAMGERQVSVEGTTHVLEEPFFVVGTQNPWDFHGTYPLPESQLDRFLMRLQIGYPAPETERDVLRVGRHTGQPASGHSVVSREELVAAQQAVADVRVEEVLLDYLHRIVLATRETPLLDLGVSTRAALAFEQATRAHALVQGRTYVIPDDVKNLAAPVLAHRIRVSGSLDSMVSRDDAERIIHDLVRGIPVPV